MIQCLYRLALHIQNVKRPARRGVIEHGDHQPPSVPSEGVKVRSVLFEDRAVRVLMMAVHDMVPPMTAIIAVIINFPDDFLWVLVVQRASRINAGMNEDAVFTDVHQWQSLNPPQVLGGYNRHIDFVASCP